MTSLLSLSFLNIVLFSSIRVNPYYHVESIFETETMLSTFNNSEEDPTDLPRFEISRLHITFYDMMCIIYFSGYLASNFTLKHRQISTMVVHITSGVIKSFFTRRQHNILEGNWIINSSLINKCASNNCWSRRFCF